MHRLGGEACSVCLCAQVAADLRGKVVEATRGLTCSVGVAPNMMLAKIASDKNKPNGQCVVGATREEVLEFIADLPIRKVGEHAHGMVQGCQCPLPSGYRRL